MARIVVRLGDRQQVHELRADVTFVGAAEDSQIRIRGDSVQERHCQLVHTGGGYRVINLSPQSEMRLNGEPVSQQTLRNGDVIQIGRFQLHFEQAHSVRRGGSAGSGPPRRRLTSTKGSQPLVRRRLRASRGMPAPVLYAILVVSLSVLGFAVWKLTTHESVDVLGLMSRAQEARDRGDWKTAGLYIAEAREAIDPSHEQWEFISGLYDEIVHHESRREQANREASQKAVFLNNLQPFYDRYIDTEDPQHKEDPSTARYFVDYRLRPFLEKYPGSPWDEKVRGWITDLSRLEHFHDPFPTTWWDHEVTHTFESTLEHHGEAYAVLRRFEAANPDSEHLEECRTKMEWELERAHRFWNEYILPGRLQPALDEKNFSGALKWALKATLNLEGIPELEAKVREKTLEVQRLAEQAGYQVDLADFGFPVEPTSQAD